MCVNDLCRPGPLLFILCRIAFRVCTKSLPYSVNIALIYFFIHLVNTVFSPQMVRLQEVRLYRKKGTFHSRLVSPATRIALPKSRSATISKEAIFGMNCRRPASAPKPTILAQEGAMHACMRLSQLLFDIMFVYVTDISSFGQQNWRKCYNRIHEQVSVWFVS